MVNIAVVGVGRWGPNLVRNMSAQPSANIVTLCDLNTELAERVAAKFCPEAKVESDIAEIARDPNVDAVVLATPVVTHFELGRIVLKGGKHLLIEKPLAQTVEECEKLIELAEKHRCILMAGHTFEYNFVVRNVESRIASGELGEVRYIHGQRVNLGQIQRDCNALWSFAPHDISILNMWLKRDPTGVSAHGFSYITSEVQDVVFLTLEYPSNIGVNLLLSWLNPLKVRQLTVIGSEKMAVFDDVSLEAKLAIHDKGVLSPKAGRVGQNDYAGFQLAIRHGDVHIPNVKYTEPLAVECEEFLAAIMEGRKPLSDGESGLRVTRVLEGAQKSLASGTGQWIALD